MPRSSRNAVCQMFVQWAECILVHTRCILHDLDLTRSRSRYWQIMAWKCCSLWYKTKIMFQRGCISTQYNTYRPTDVRSWTEDPNTGRSMSRYGMLYINPTPMGKVPHHLALRMSFSINSCLEPFRGLCSLVDIRDNEWLVWDGTIHIAYQGELASIQLWLYKKEHPSTSADNINQEIYKHVWSMWKDVPQVRYGESS